MVKAVERNEGERIENRMQWNRLDHTADFFAGRGITRCRRPGHACLCNGASRVGGVPRQRLVYIGTAGGYPVTYRHKPIIADTNDWNNLIKR